jgi:hypothetical protein
LSGLTYFFYGSLMDRELLEAVLGRKASNLTFVPGWLTDYVAETAKGYTFPTLLERKGGRVDGIVTHGLTQADADRIAYYEDNDEYSARVVDIGTATTDVAAQIFMAATPLMSSGEAWSFERWRKHDKPLLLAITRKVMREHYGVTPANEIHPIWMRIKDELEAEMSGAAVRKIKRVRTPAPTPAAPRRAARAASPTRRPRGS